jgi:hypothetical protein
MFFTPSTGRLPSIGSFAACTSAPTRTSTDETPGTVSTAFSTASFISDFLGQAGVVSTRSRETSPPETFTFRIMERLTRSRPSSGSITWERAERTPSTVASGRCSLFLNRDIASSFFSFSVHDTTGRTARGLAGGKIPFFAEAFSSIDYSQ